VRNVASIVRYYGSAALAVGNEQPGKFFRVEPRDESA
jgi:hypothetical protein